MFTSLPNWVGGTLGHQRPPHLGWTSSGYALRTQAPAPRLPVRAEFMFSPQGFLGLHSVAWGAGSCRLSRFAGGSCWEKREDGQGRAISSSGSAGTETGAVGNGPGDMGLEQVLWATLAGSRETRCPEPLSGRSVGPCGFRVLSPDTSRIPAPPAS